MKSSYLTNLVLLAIVIALLWLSQREQPAEQQTSTLSSLAPEAIELIQIARAGKVNLRLERQQNHWILSEPFNARANPTPLFRRERLRKLAIFLDLCRQPVL